MEPGATGAVGIGGPTTPEEAEEAAPAADGAEPKRGWTMFMDAPIDPNKPSPLGATPTVPVPPESSADGRGWTVFGAPAVPRPDESTSGPGGGATGSPPPDAGADTDADGTPGRGKTIVAAGISATAGSVGGITGRPGAGQPATVPDTQYFRRGDIAPERPAQRSTAVDVSGSVRPAEERMHESLAVPPGRDAPLATNGSSAVVWIVIGGVVIVGAIVGAIVAFT